MVFTLITLGWQKTFLLLWYDPGKGLFFGFRVRNHRIKITELQILKIRIRFWSQSFNGLDSTRQHDKIDFKSAECHLWLGSLEANQVMVGKGDRSTKEN